MNSETNRVETAQSKGQMEDADAIAIGRVRAGDSDAYRLLVERYSRSVFRLAYRMIGNEFDAEDVVQETFLRAYRQLAKYESRSSFSTWIYRIAANYALDLIRARRRQQNRKAAEEDRDMLDLVEANDPSPDRLYYGSEVRTRLQGALAELTEQERTAFLLRHFEGKSIDEIGEVLGTARSATKNSVFRAVKKLREALDPLVSSCHASHNG